METGLFFGGKDKIIVLTILTFIFIGPMTALHTPNPRPMTASPTPNSAPMTASPTPNSDVCPPVPTSIFDAIMGVESGGDIYAIGDGGGARGPFQIHTAYWEDARQYDPSLSYGGNTYGNCYGEGSIEYSRRVIQAYMSHYATFERLGHCATAEDIARIHNGGPNGFRRSATLSYWVKVQMALN